MISRSPSPSISTNVGGALNRFVDVTGKPGLIIPKLSIAYILSPQVQTTMSGLPSPSRSPAAAPTSIFSPILTGNPSISSPSSVIAYTLPEFPS